MIKRVLKRGGLLVCALIGSPLALVAHLGRRMGTEAPFSAAAQALSLVPGRLGDYMRLGFYTLTLRRVSPDVTISFGTLFSKQDVTIGKNVSIGGYCILGRVELGDGVMIASRVSILSGKYQHGSALVPVEAGAGNRYDRIAVGHGSWIGEGAVVAAGVGKHCIVAAGAVVTRDVPDGFMAAGNPARLMRIPKHSPPQPFPSVFEGSAPESTPSEYRSG